ncbi:Nitrogen regulatory protein P-II [Sporomusa acidovorans DSM 3132]|uniref:Nitrogen regulatory protein P-II n=1 Tax=Sporomusa acidovorans (strain ATCC 49682 / DSM 3132 / Mol) TaxID=1123286 RepID=A0ABZ3J8A3_SPOA4|nr:P-II family nitrogen regulator [Sporomusa acidovorans]OZC21293.1 nitrogen regulatory protein P-II [Sporomusa acidovorans DSM 3132]SDE67369.1 nitrogen regulatory protein P-II family [Sporomusa acidovorans]
MRKIDAIIRPDRLNAVKEALVQIGVKGMTVSEVFGCGLQKGHTSVYRGQEYKINLLPKVKIEIVIPAGMVQDVVTVIKEQAYSGKIGDGKIFIYPVENVYRIRTDESGIAAL